MVGINNITYAGNHGLEILHPDGTKFVHPMPLSYEEKVRTLLKELQEEVLPYFITYLYTLMISRSVTDSQKLISSSQGQLHLLCSCAMMEHGWKTKDPF